MFLRKLTDNELAWIKKAKEAANKAIKEQRKKLLTEIKPLEKLRGVYKNPTLETLKQQLEDLRLVSGHPVMLTHKDDNWSLYTNYTLLKKIESSLKRSCFWELNLETKIYNDRPSLVLKYRNQTCKGQMEIYELPQHQVALLIGLPVIEVKCYERF